MKNNPVQRIKLMMSYEMGKTLEENLINLPVINENENEIDEQGAQELVKGLKIAQSVESKIPALARFFNITDDAVKLAYAKDLTALTKDVEKAIANDIKSGFKGGGSALGPLSKEVSKQQAIKEILSTERKLSEAEIIQIIERYKSINKQKAAAAEAKAASKSSKGSKVATDSKTVSTDVKAAEAEIKAGVTNATKEESVVVLTNTAKEAPSEIKGIIEANKSRIKEMSEIAFNKFKNVGKRLGAKWIIGLGLAAAGGVYLMSRIFGGTTRPDGTNTIHPKCITDLLDDDGATVTATTGGDPVVMVTKTGNQEYDALGGLKFYTNGRVISKDNTKKGYWSCKSGEVVVSEMVNEQISDATMDSDVNRMIDLLDFPVTGGNLQDALTLLKKYSNSPRGKEFLDLYKDSGLGGGDLKKSLDYVVTTQPASVRAKREMYKVLTQIESGQVTGDGNKNTGIGNIEIRWDGATPDDGSSNTDETPVVTDGGKKTGRFVDCESQPLPHKFGCKSSKILEVQKCLGITSDGKFGPNTLKALVDAKHAVTESGLTQEIYDLVLKNCKSDNTTGSTTNTTGTTTGDTATTTGTTTGDTATNTVDPTQPMTTPEVPSEPVYNTRRLQELVASRNLVKKRNGIIVKWKGPELSGNDYFILNKYLTDQGYTQKTQREVGDRDDQDVEMRYKWKKNEQ